VTRTIISVVLPFILPFVCFAIWSWYSNRKRRALDEGEPLQSWQSWPWSKLVLSGGVLAIASLMFLLFGREPLPEGRWVPPSVVDGEVVPGYYEPIPEPTDD